MMGRFNTNSMLILLVVWTLMVGVVHSQENTQYGLLKIVGAQNDSQNTVESGGNKTHTTRRDFCFVYNADMWPLSKNGSKTYRIIDATNRSICGESDTPPNVPDDGIDNLFLMEGKGNCTFPQYVEYAKEHHGRGFFLNLYLKQKINDTYGMAIFGTIGNQTLQELKDYDWTHDMMVQLYALTFDDIMFSGSVFLLWLTACFCVAVGSLTGPYQDLQSTSSRQQILEGSSTTSQESSKNVQINFSITLVLTLVFFITATLMLLYYFYNYLVYFFMVVFCVAAGRAAYELINQVARVFKMDACMPRIRDCGIHRLVSAAVCLAMSVVWIIFRHDPHIWILQDFLGICFCVHLIQTLRIPNLKICASLLSLLFFYDVFFVFITPYITSNGKSVMVEVATGGSSGESLPLLIKYPRTVGPVECNFGQSYSLLGFGDIIVPGFLVCFAHSFDIIRGDKWRPYFCVTMIGYMFGLFGAFVALVLTESGQPALLYIVPCTLIPICITGAIRKQFRDLWRGSITITEVEP